MPNLKSSSSEFFLLVFVGGAVALGLGAISFTQPLTREVAAPLNYEQSGAFSYTATDTHGIYDDGVVQTGNPLFRKLADTLTVTLQYTLTGQELQAINGVVRMDAVVSDGTGWQRHLELMPATSFADTTFSASAPLNLAEIQALIDSLEQTTGLKRAEYDVDIQPDIQVAGILGGGMWRESFGPRLSFKLDKDMLTLAKPGGTTPDENQLNPSKTGAVERTVSQPASLTILGLSLPVQSARNASVAGVILALLGGLALVMFQRHHPNPAELIQYGFADMLVSVSNVECPRENLVDVNSIEDLAKLAEKEGRMIMHVAAGSGHYYFVQESTTTYRYAIDLTGAPPGPPSMRASA